MIKMKASGKRFFSNTKVGVCNDGVKILVISVPDPSFTLTPTAAPTIIPDIPISYEIYNWKQGATFNNIDTLVNQHIIIH